MAVTLIDTHCHLDYPYQDSRLPAVEEIAATLQRAAAAGVKHCVTIGTNVDFSYASILLARQWPQVRAAVGIHPNDCAAVNEALLQKVQQLSREPEVVAIGEVGLDQYRKTVELAKQQDVLRAFLGMARHRHLPVLIHCRDAYAPLLDTLREMGASWQGVIHCASGPEEFIQGALALGLHISFAGNVTFPNAKALHALVPLVPEDRLLVETDAPFLAPQPVRGQKNEPAYVAHTAAFVAQLRGVSFEHLATVTTRNACALFKFPADGVC